MYAEINISEDDRSAKLMNFLETPLRAASSLIPQFSVTMRMSSLGRRAKRLQLSIVGLIYSILSVLEIDSSWPVLD